MAGYTKLFSSILDSTVWRESDPTRILWITMLALVDQDGIVHCTAPGLADRARITIDQSRAGLQRLQDPDPDSLTQDYEGRRIKRVPTGWLILNYEKYRHLMSEEDRREKTRLRVQRFRDRNNVTLRNACNDIAEADTEAKADKKIKIAFAQPSMDEVVFFFSEQSATSNPQEFYDYYMSNGWRVGRNPMKDWRAAARRWERNGHTNGGNSNGKVFVSKDEQIKRKNRESIEQYRLSCSGADGKPV